MEFRRLPHEVLLNILKYSSINDIKNLCALKEMTEKCSNKFWHDIYAMKVDNINFNPNINWKTVINQIPSEPVWDLYFLDTSRGKNGKFEILKPSAIYKKYLPKNPPQLKSIPTDKMLIYFEGLKDHEPTDYRPIKQFKIHNIDDFLNDVINNSQKGAFTTWYNKRHNFDETQNIYLYYITLIEAGDYHAKMYIAFKVISDVKEPEIRYGKLYPFYKYLERLSKRELFPSME